MLWTEIRSWAKKLGYETIKDKDDGKYYWAKLDDQTNQIGGVSTSLSKLALAIYNHYTENKWVDHQNEYRQRLEEA